MPQFKNKREIEYEFYSRKTSGYGLPATKTLADMKHAYWRVTVGSVKPEETASDLEFRWLKSLTGVTGKTIPDMWREAVVGLSKAGVTPGNSLDENQALYYTFAP